eukprot:TRINITY_DN2493_c0_g1_i1.p2 TRINITY_DN2493_c0_g1~~TRINITY_DN2493_c0_g1_i1.p2  ORF type:complete len:103 (-),score=1.23 TRINITY_DN2493_c0_g1_i1:241-549(-)
MIRQEFLGLVNGAKNFVSTRIFISSFLFQVKSDRNLTYSKGKENTSRVKMRFIQTFDGPPFQGLYRVQKLSIINDILDLIFIQLLVAGLFPRPIPSTEDYAD